MPGVESILLILLLLLIADPALTSSKAGRWDWMGALALIGVGFGKLNLLAGEVLEIHLMCVNAAPEAMNSWSAFIGLLSFALLPWLVVSGFSDLAGAILKLAKRVPETTVNTPFWATGFVDFWDRWGLPFRSGRRVQARRTYCIVVVTVFLWVLGWPDCLLLWLGLQGALVLLDIWLVRQWWWRVRMPESIKMVLVTLTVLIGLPLAYAGGWDKALKVWGLIVNPPLDTVYTLFMDQRLITVRTSLILWAGLLSALLVPGMGWWLGQGGWLRRVALLFGLLLFSGQALVGTAYFLPGKARTIAQGIRLWLDSDGENGVSIGDEGWLYRRQELDRFTQRRTDGGLMKEVLHLHERLKRQGGALLLLPVPDKLWLYPEPVLPGKYWGPFYPPGYRTDLKLLREAGVDVLDLADSFLWENRRRRPLYFKQDSGWRAEAMKEVAVQTSHHIRKTYPQVVKKETPPVHAEFIRRQDIGDLARLLTPWKPEWHWPSESTHMVGLTGLPDDGRPPVLLVGGNLLRMYDGVELTFGPEVGKVSQFLAGWPTQLGALLGRKLATASVATGQEVAVSERLVVLLPGKKLVVWVVGAGEL